MIRSAQTRFARVLLTLAVALLPVFSGISGGLHLLLVRHVVCPAHGELIHADETCGVPVAGSSHALSHDESSQPGLESDTSRSAPKDEHCLVSILTRTSFVSWSAADGKAFILRESVAGTVREPSRPAPQVELLFLAPKQSPPV
ncbi:MAG TPA: hypothetical protein VK843_11675 [Planctomycetota bacterium]|nr:hypothetical protein [Planctomycetota bacterium]